MGIFDLLFGENDDSSENPSKKERKVSINNPLEKAKQAAIQELKDEYYQKCFSELTRQIPNDYKNNKNKCLVCVRRILSPVILDDDTIHKVLTKASYDAMKSVGLESAEKPFIENSGRYWNFAIKLK